MLLHCLSGRRCQYQQGESLLQSGALLLQIGVVLSGELLQEECGTPPRRLEHGALFGELHSCAGVLKSPLSIYAATNCEVLMLNLRRTLSTCATSCTFHNRLIQNLLREIASQALMLQHQNAILGSRTIRERLLTYLAQQPFDEHGQIVLSLSRAALADYLCVDRSALSRELHRMSEEGLLRFHRNTFICKKTV